ncbi:hypothetical protein DOTSEDRAFT_159937 [Dothistroma septosporum NZE10]|uniref:Heme haloperoxidase family profile domain-containing protein n=1 Tax=Dothistroma septosporum (strain NZE10 / CBS 128990) TaxID=675120 RepID=M2YL26_DOTSN|nr:hypothetical protein DOTSEDRAFT_159937 [Dothistroma septosporum NZE10]
MFTDMSLALTQVFQSVLGFAAVNRLAWISMYNDWRPADPEDSRGPCPMLNTFANHGMLPRDGRNITIEDVQYAMGKGLNYGEEIIKVTFEAAITTNPIPNSTWFDLWHLGRPHLLEHDASLSRRDSYLANASIFDQHTFDETKSFWKGETLDKMMLTNSKIGRQLASRVSNPTYTFTEKIAGVSTGELSSLVLTLGNQESITVSRNFVEYFFENERLPISLGWTPPE